MENPTHSFRETNLVRASPHIRTQIKSKTVIGWISRKKKEGIFCIMYFIRGENLCFISVYSVLNRLSEYTYQKTLSHTL